MVSKWSRVTRWDAVPREEEGLDAVICPFHCINAAVVLVEYRTERMFERVVGVTPSLAFVRAIVPAVSFGFHADAGSDVAFALLVGDVQGHLDAVRVVGLLNYVDFAFGRPLGGAGCHPEGGPGAADTVGLFVSVSLVFLFWGGRWVRRGVYHMSNICSNKSTRGVRLV